MFEKLRNAFTSVAKSLGEKELKEKDIDEVLSELEVALLESDVAMEVIDSIKSDLKKQLTGATVQKDKVVDFVKQNLRQCILNMFDEAGKINILSNIQKKRERNEPYIVLFMGINGTGKTTTIAKFANLLRENKFSSVIAAADTYRAGAIEQIAEHGKRLNVKVVAQNYGSDPAAVARDAVLYAQSHKIDCVLIDTAGRMQTSKNLMDQISKINKVVNPDVRLFVGDALAGNDTVSQAREFYNYTTFDGAILTKSDADARGGAAISIVKITSSPILYLGVGQEYKDLKAFDKDSFLESLFGPKEVPPEISVQSKEISVQSKETSKQKMMEKELLIDKRIKVIEKPEIKVVRSEVTAEVESVATRETPDTIRAKITQEATGTNEFSRSFDESFSAKPKPDSTSNPKPEIRQEKVEQLTNESEEDPFSGIATKDIEKYSELFDVPPPGNDNEAKQLAARIRKWILDGRPKSTDSNEEIIDAEINQKEDGKVSEDKKLTKKRSRFGWMKK